MEQVISSQEETEESVTNGSQTTVTRTTRRTQSFSSLSQPIRKKNQLGIQKRYPAFPAQSSGFFKGFGRFSATNFQMEVLNDGTIRMSADTIDKQ